MVRDAATLHHCSRPPSQLIIYRLAVWMMGLVVGSASGKELLHIRVGEVINAFDHTVNIRDGLVIP